MLSSLIGLLSYILIGTCLAFVYNVYIVKKANKKKQTFKSDHNMRKFDSLIDDSWADACYK